MVRIDVTIRTTGKLHVLETSRPSGGIRLVAFFARHLNVQAGQRVSRLGVVELLRCLPVAYVVAVLALLSKLSLVVVLMACNAFGGRTEIRARGILSL